MPLRLSGRSADALCVALVIAANPALYSFGSSSFSHGHDSVAYLTMARGLLDGLALYLPSWGHVDAAVILPPVFPALIAMGSLVTDNPLAVAERVSTLASILGGILLYFLLRPHTHRAVALSAAGLVQVTSTYFELAFAPLTEAVFMALCSCTLLALRSFARRDGIATGIGVGLLCGLVYLTRQMGLIVLLFSLLWIAATGWARGDSSRKTTIRVLTIVVGFAVLLAPYAALLYQQTGQHPLRQAFRMGSYLVHSEDPRVLETLERAESEKSSNYADAFRLRRKMFQLVPDGTEMYRFVQTSRSGQTDDSRIQSILRNLRRDPMAFATNLRTNATHLEGEVGWALILLFLATTATSALVRRSSAGFPERCMLAAFTCFYFLSQSLITGLVDRYVAVLVPFLLISTAAELYRLAAELLARTGARSHAWACGVALVALCIALLPQHFGSYRALGESVPIERRPHWRFRQVIARGEPVFCFSALDAYLIGASFRILPNDSLPRVVKYARRTGVRWIFVAHSQRHLNEMKSYVVLANWYSLDRLERDYASLVVARKLIFGPASRFVLYEILE